MHWPSCNHAFTINASFLYVKIFPGCVRADGVLGHSVGHLQEGRARAAPGRGRLEGGAAGHGHAHLLHSLHHPADRLPPLQVDSSICLRSRPVSPNVMSQFVSRNVENIGMMIW